MPNTYKPQFTEKTLSSWAIFKRSLGYFRPYLFYVFLACIAMVVTALCNAGTAWLVKPALDDIFIEKDATMLILIPVAFMAVSLGKVGARMAQNYLMQYCGYKVLEDLRDELFAKIIKLPLRFYERTQVGMLMSRILGDVTSVRTSMPALVMIIRQIIIVIGLLCVAISQNPKLSFVALVVMPIAFYPFYYFGRRLRKLGRDGQAKSADVSIVLQEILSGIRVVKAFCTETHESKRFDKENRRLLRISLKQGIASEFSSCIMEMIGALGISMVLWYGGMQVIEGTATPGTFFSFVTALIMLYEPIKKMSSSSNDIQRALAGAERVFSIIDSDEVLIEKSGNVVFAGPFRELQFENVDFAYNETSGNVLSDVSVTIRAGERVAIVGPSGGGKTTFVNMIPRFYDPDSGTIRINGTSLAEYTLDSLRHNISMVSQDSFLFNLSVRDNIAYGMSGVTEDDIVAAAKAAFVHDFVEKMPGGYNTVVGERGVMLSGGQKQRITIARALVKNAPLLILDEATSALDSESERVVQQALENLMVGRTSIVIAHRLSTVLNSDRILVMDKGRLVAAGPHAELLQTSPLYARLYAMQFNLQNEQMAQ